MRARGGADFCKLVKEYSDDQATIESCGSRGPLSLDALVVPVREAIAKMKEKEIADPIYYAAPQDPAMLVVQLVKSPRIPTYEEVKDQMTDRAFGEAMERQRKLWLQELRRGVYVDVRL
jgi:peptidyl-prolyl cis-trans isomerase SurA